MAYFSWLEQARQLSAAALTVRVQTISPNDEGLLSYQDFAPLVNVDSTNIQEILTIDWRPVADRREWRLRGRHIPVKTPDRIEATWTPIESYFKIDEEEINKLFAAVNGNEAAFRERIEAAVPNRTDMLARANWRRVNVDWFTAWALNQLSVKNAETGTTTTVSLGMAAARYTTAVTAWNDVSVNAYDLLLTWLSAAVDLVGPIEGVMLRLATYNAIRDDAPNPFGPTATIRMTRDELSRRVADELGLGSFTFAINENSHDIFNDAGDDTTRVKEWAAQRVAVIPAGGQVGSTYRAPVARAYDIANVAPEASIDVRGMTVFNEIGGGGRDLTVECQGNILPLPNEQRCYVINAGI